MRALILCPGPSLARATELPPHDVLLAINLAMNHPLAAGADWWVALDRWRRELPVQAPRCGMVTSSAAIAEGQADDVPWPLYDAIASAKVKATATSMPAALWWAWHCGATSIELIGCDMQGLEDFRGVSEPGRTEDRWTRERREVLRMVERTGVELKGLPWPS